MLAAFLKRDLPVPRLGIQRGEDFGVRWDARDGISWSGEWVQRSFHKLVKLGEIDAYPDPSIMTRTS